VKYTEDKTKRNNGTENKLKEWFLLFVSVFEADFYF